MKRRANHAVAAMLTFVTLAVAGCALNNATSVVNPDALAIADARKAESSYLIVVKHVRGRVEAAGGAAAPGPIIAAEKEFKASARVAWRGIEAWRAGEPDTAYRAAWTEMLAKAFAVELLVRR